MSTGSTFSDKIRALEPQNTDVAIVTNGRIGTLSILIETNGALSHIKFNAAGWRALQAAVGTAPTRKSTFRRTS